MNAMNMLNLVLWIVQGLLALFFLAAGAPKVIGRGLERWTGFSDLPGPMVVFIGFTEVLGAAGLVLPMATGVIGRRVVPLLVAAGHRVTAVGRAPDKRAALERAGAAAIELDLFDSAALAVLAGSLGETLARSQRIANGKLRAASGWAPRYPSVVEGWSAVVAALRTT